MRHLLLYPKRTCDRFPIASDVKWCSSWRRNGSGWLSPSCRPSPGQPVRWRRATWHRSSCCWWTACWCRSRRTTCRTTSMPTQPTLLCCPSRASSSTTSSASAPNWAADVTSSSIRTFLRRFFNATRAKKSFSSMSNDLTLISFIYENLLSVEVLTLRACWMSCRSPSQAIVLRRFLVDFFLLRLRLFAARCASFACPPPADASTYSKCCNERRNWVMRSKPEPVTSSRTTSAGNTCEAAALAFSSGDGNLFVVFFWFSRSR